MQAQTPHPYPSIWHSTGAALLAVVLWALIPLLVTSAEGLPPLRLSTLALLAGALATLPMARRRRRGESDQPLGQGLIVYAGVSLLIAVAVGGCFMSFSLAPTAEAALIAYTWPVFFLLASQWLTTRRLTLTTLIGALLAFSGAALLVAPQALASGLSGPWHGYLLALAAALCWALYSLACQVPAYRLGERLPHLLLIASLITGAASLALEGMSAMPSPTALLATAVLGLGPYGIAMLAWERALQAPQAQRLGNLAHAVPVLATLFLMLAGVTAPDWRLPIAAGLVVWGSIVASAGAKASARRLSNKRPEMDIDLQDDPTRLH